MERFDGLGLGFHQELIAALQVLAAKVLHGEVHQLEVGAGGTIKEQDPLTERRQVGVGACGEAGQDRDTRSHE